jgi:nicotinate-nucleotide adenylyltransferase
MRLGLLGGTFDPIHTGHLDVARAAKRALSLDEVWLLPARQPPHRHHPRASAAHRFAMAALATADEPGLLVSDLEMDRPGPSYTVDTLKEVASVTKAGAEIFFLIGADAFRDVPTWRAYPAVLDGCHFVVVSRPGVPVGELPGRLPTLAPRMVTLPSPIPATPSIFLVEAPTSPASSTEIRRRIEEGRPIDDLVSGSVAAYVAKHRLYQGQEKTNA